MSDLEGSLEPFLQRDPVGSFGGGWGGGMSLCLGPGFEDLTVEATLIKYVRHIPRGGGTMKHALERWARRSSSKAGQVSSPALCAEATTGLHRPGLP